MLMIEREITYPFVVSCWPEAELTNLRVLREWLDRYVQWDGKMETRMGQPEGAPTRLYAFFRVHSAKDVELLKKRFGPLKKPTE